MRQAMQRAGYDVDHTPIDKLMADTALGLVVGGEMLEDDEPCICGDPDCDFDCDGDYT